MGGNRPWHLWVDEASRPGWANMAADLALLERAELGEGWFRLYSWDPHCLSFGRHEPAARRYDAGRIRALGLDTVRRPTGGRAVWHARELTYAVAAPHLWFGSLREAYRAIHDLLARALGLLGIRAALAPHRSAPPLDGGPCFAQPVGGEVLVDETKVIGSAQLRRGTALLQHGSIILRNDQQWIESLVRGAEPSPTTCSESSDFTLVDGAGRPLSRGQLAAALGDSAQQSWPGKWLTLTDSGAILRAASAHFHQFRSSTWTWSR